MRLHLFTYLGLAAFTFGLGTACSNSGGQTGDLSGEHDEGPTTGENASGGCEEKRQLLASFDERTDAGTASELLAYAEGEFEAPIVWKTASDGQGWTVGPETGEGTVHIAVEGGAKAYFLTYEPKPSQSGIEVGVICPPAQLGVEAHVRISTEGGALAEELDTLVRTSAPGVANLSLPLDLSQLSGELAVSLANPNSKLVQARLEATLTGAGTAGSIAGIVQTDHGEVTSGMQALLAVWPQSAACAALNPDGQGLGVAAEDEVLGATGTETLAAVSTPTPVAVRWLDGSETTLTLEVTALGDGCLSDSPLPVEIGGGANVVYPVSFAIASADGRLRGEYTGTVRASGAGGHRQIEATASIDLPPEQIADSGFAEATLPDDADGATVQLSVMQRDTAESSSIQLLAYSNPPCLTTPPEPMETPGGGTSVPGCAGQTRTQLEAASW